MDMTGNNLYPSYQLLSVVSPIPIFISSALNYRLLETIPDSLRSWTRDRICQWKHSLEIGKWSEGKAIHLTVTVVAMHGAVGDWDSNSIGGSFIIGSLCAWLPVSCYDQ